MANYLKMPTKQQVLALLDLGCSYRRIESETGIRRETVSRYAAVWRANAAKTSPGSEPPSAGANAEMSHVRISKRRALQSSCSVSL